MGRQKWIYRVEPCNFPEDFPERLDSFRRAAGLSWRGLARALRVDVGQLRRWRRGARPDAGNLIALQVLATRMGLMHLLMPELAGGEESDQNAA